MISIAAILAGSTLTPNKRPTTHPFFSDLWISIPFNKSLYYETIYAPGKDSQHIVHYGLKPSKKKGEITTHFEIINFSTNRIIASSAKESVQLSDTQHTVKNIRFTLPKTLPKGFYYFKLFINNEFIDYATYNTCSGKVIAYK